MDTKQAVKTAARSLAKLPYKFKNLAQSSTAQSFPPLQKRQYLH